MLISRVGPRLRMFLRVVAFIGILGFLSGLADSIIEARSLSESLGYAQSYAFQYLIFLGVAYGTMAIMVTLMFDYEPKPRRFTLVMALAFAVLPSLLLIYTLDQAQQYPNTYGVSEIMQGVVHIAAVLGLSQFVSQRYLREISPSNTQHKAK